MRSTSPDLPEYELALDDVGDVAAVSGAGEILASREVRDLRQGLTLQVGGDSLLRGEIRRLHPLVDQRLHVRKIRPAKPGLGSVRAQHLIGDRRRHVESG